MGKCETCASWTRRNPNDITAGEGKCGLPKDPGFYPFYWPNTLRRDYCRKFEAHTPQALTGTKEETP